MYPQIFTCFPLCIVSHLHIWHAGVPHSPEVFCRPDGTAYIVEGAEIVPLPDDPLEVMPDEQQCASLQVLLLLPVLSRILQAESTSVELECWRRPCRPMLNVIPHHLKQSVMLGSCHDLMRLYVCFDPEHQDIDAAMMRTI